MIDAYGATEGGVAVNRDAEQRAGALGLAPAHVKVVDEDGNEKPRRRARRRRAGSLNADECVGEIVNTQGVGPFEGYYNNADATAKTTRFGWYWSGDLGYLDADGYLYFAGRNADWIRVDGENFPAGPIEEALRDAPRRRARRGLRRARRPGRRPGDGRARARATASTFDPAGVRGVARRAGRTSARSGGRATCACCATRRPPARTRS